MSTNGNGWKPRKSEKWTCPSGQEVWTRQPGPEFTLRLGRTPNALNGSKDVPKQAEGESEEDYGKRVMEHVSDEDLVTHARQLIVAMVESPKLVLDPKPGELGPDDTGTDFWPLFQYGMDKYFKVKGKVKVGDGEVEASVLETFPGESAVSGDGVDSAPIPVPESQSEVTDQGLAHSAGD